MKSKSEITRKIQETLESLEGIQRASAPDFFFTRLQGRLYKETRSTWEVIGSFIARPVVFASLLSLVLLTNLFVVYKEELDSNSQANIERTVEDYTLGIASYYESEITEP